MNHSNKDTGGNVFRTGFQQLIFDCYEDQIDIVLVKTISRFARNTVDLFETVRRLKGLGVEVIFHQENIRTIIELEKFEKVQAESERRSNV